jgi:hypothetical protein
MPRSRRKDGFKTKVTADRKAFSTPKSPKKAPRKPKIEDDAIEKALKASLLTSISDNIKRKYSGIIETFNRIRGRTITSRVIDTSQYSENHILETGGGGDCLFHAISYELRRLGLIDVTHESLRQEVAEAMTFLENENLLEDVIIHVERIVDEELNTKSKRLKYIKRMSRQGTWGTELEIFIVFLLYPNINMVVFRLDDEKKFYVWVYDALDTSSQQYIRIFNNGVDDEGDHYQVMVDFEDLDGRINHLIRNLKRRKV